MQDLPMSVNAALKMIITLAHGIFEALYIIYHL